jgi:hypothetical protein
VCSDALEVALPDGSCVRPGVPLDGCANGFVHDGQFGCEPVLPVDTCARGLMAVPGEAACRPVMDCGSGKWGMLPVDATTVYVDASYSGGDGDGSEAKPWPSIAEAVAAAPSDALVAVAAGSYAESIVLADKPIRLWGVCPEHVTMESPGPPAGCPASTVCILRGADGSEVGGMSLTGAGAGIALSGSEEVFVDRVRVHDNAGRGINGENTLGSTSIEVRGSLIEQNEDFGVLGMGALVNLDSSVVRATQPNADGNNGLGVSIQVWCRDEPGDQYCEPTSPGSGSVSNSLIEENHELGVLFMGAEASMEATVVRRTFPVDGPTGFGHGVAVQMACLDTPAGLACDAAARSNVTITGSLIEDMLEAGVLILGADAALDRTVVRNTAVATDGRFGDGVAVVVSGPDVTASVAIDRSHVAHSARAGVAVFGSTLSLGTSAISCSAFDLQGEAHHRDFELDDRGGSRCGCDEPEVCRATSTGIEPPVPL